METKTTLTSLTGEKSTRRVVLGTGLKLGYAAPLVAASFKLNSLTASADKKKTCCKSPKQNVKVAICHKENKDGRPADYHVICVDEEAVQAHLDHGDTVLGVVPLDTEQCFDEECGGGEVVSL